MLAVHGAHLGPGVVIHHYLTVLWLYVPDTYRLSALLVYLRTMTFLWLNTLDKRQLATSIVKSYPYWSLPLTSEF